MFTHVHIMLKADQGKYGPDWRNDKFNNTRDITLQTIKRIRKQFVEEGFGIVKQR